MSKYMTFNQWKEIDFMVKKGSRATWVNGVAMFTDEQVEEFDYMGHIAFGLQHEDAGDRD